jgi:MtN3 and saliva related transmembrane protein
MQGTVVTLVGTAASSLSTFSLLPQAIRTWRTRSAGDISTIWLVIALISMLLWVAYGSLVQAAAVVWANLLTAIQALFILVVKFRGGRATKAYPGASSQGGAL